MWQGRRLALFSHVNGEQYMYTYNSDGIRTGKQIRNADNALITGVEYIYDGSKLVAESRNGEWMYYVYDETGSIAGVSYNGVLYLFRKNLQGDVTGIYNANGALVVEYTYSPYGEVLSVTGTMANTIGTINPIRYRGYYYDTETGFYYLQSRYYDPTVGRFINADETDILTATTQALTDKNLFAYCDNNPVVRLDRGGQFWDTFFNVVSLGASVIEVCKNPTDPLAWAGLAGDVVSLAVPGVTGGGTAVKAICKADDVVDVVKTANNVDNVVDTAKIAKKGWSVGDDITALTKSGKDPSWSTVRSRYWKNEEYYAGGNYSIFDRNRMKQGKPPLIQYKNGKYYPMELHHKIPKHKGGSNSFYNLQPLAPWEHANIDPFRYFVT